MIRLIDISKSYDGKPVLSHVNLTLEPGITCLMGVSGRGKTTLLRILLGLETPDGGQVEGRPDRVAVQFQEDRLVESLTVGRNLKLALGRDYNAEKAEACLAALGLPDSQRLHVSVLSGGMKRRVALARALLYPAELLVLDEPFQGLDADTRQAALAAVRQAAKGRTALIVTHEAQDCRQLSARLITL